MHVASSDARRLEAIGCVRRLACADHKTLLAMNMELDGLVARIQARAGLDASKALLDDIEVCAD
jgi:hypothetical protein